MTLEGFLNKEENELTRSKRWFQIDLVQQRLYYYKNKDKEELLGFLSLSDVVDIDPLNDLNFMIKTNEGEPWNLFAFSTDEMKIWIDSLQKAIKDINQKESDRVSEDDSPSIVKDKTTASYEDLALFEFEDFSKPIDHSGGFDQLDLDDNEEIAELGAKIDKKNSGETNVASSVPISIPHFSKTWQSESNWQFSDEESNEEDITFEKPHELAAKTYKEQYLINGLELDVPKSSVNLL